MPRLTRSWPRRLSAALALIVAVTVVVLLVLSSESSTPSRAASDAATVTGAVTIQRQNLVETDTESGTLSYANPQTVYNRLSGTITWLPQVGQVIKPGQTLFKVDGSPVILMSGTTPAYRDLSADDSAGQDILELNRNLVKLGFNPDGIVVDDTWQAATTDGVDVLQAYLGQTETGILSLGQVVFLPGDQLVSSVSASLGSTGGGGGSSNPSSASLDPVRPTPEFVSLQTTTSTTPAQGGGSGHGSKPSGHRPSRSGAGRKPSKGSLHSLEQLIALLEAEIAHLQSTTGSRGSSGSKSPGHSGSGGKSSSSASGGGGGGGGGTGGGGGGGNASPVLATTSTQLVVTVDLDASKQSEAKGGEKVSVEMPAGNTTSGRIIAVSPVAQSSSNSGDNGSGGNGAGSGSSSPTIPVTIALNGRQTGAGLDQAAVSVNFVQAVAKNVLSVPVTALLATPGGGYAVQEAAAPHKLLRVQTGLFAAGDVQISGAGIYPGLKVTASQG